MKVRIGRQYNPDETYLSFTQCAHDAPDQAYKDWRALWEKNGALAAKRGDNPHLLFHGDSQVEQGDEITVPDQQEKTEGLSQETVNQFKVGDSKLYLRLQILDETLQPLKDAHYDLKVGGRQLKQGEELGANGLIDVEVEKREATQGELTLTLPPLEEEQEPSSKKSKKAQNGGVIKYTLHIGRLDPILQEAPDKACTAGVQARLNNLAFDCGRVDGDCGKATQAALTRFQRRMGIRATGNPDVATQTELQKLHDTTQTGPTVPEEKSTPVKEAPSSTKITSEELSEEITVTEVTDQSEATAKPTKASITVYRETYTKKSTIGSMHINGRFFCYTLEDFVRRPFKKVKKVTAIPAGKYEVVVDMSQRFKKMMPRLKKVPHFKGIRIHTGNQASHSEGCILVGKKRGKNRIDQSRLAYNALMAELEKYEELEITIIDAPSRLGVREALISKANRNGAKHDIGFVALDVKGGQHCNTLVLRPAYRISLRLLDDMDQFFPGNIDTAPAPANLDAAAALTANLQGLAARLQALEYFGVPLNHARATECLKVSWKYFKEHVDSAGPIDSDAHAKTQLKNMLQLEILEGGALPAEGQVARIMIPGGYGIRDVNTADTYFTGATYAVGNETSHYAYESVFRQANPHIGKLPLIAKVEQRYPGGPWRPAAGASVYFQLVRPTNAELRKCQPSVKLESGPRQYVATHAASDANDPQLANAPNNYGGKRGNPVAGPDREQNVFETGNEWHGIHQAHRTAEGRQFEPEGRKPILPAKPPDEASGIAHAARAVTNENGEAGVVFAPSRCAGDKYKIRAFVGSPTLQSDGAEIEGGAKVSHVIQTGAMVVWRTIRVSQVLHQPNYEASSSFFSKVKEFLKLTARLDPLSVEKGSFFEKQYRRCYHEVKTDNRPATFDLARWQAAFESARASAVGNPTQRVIGGIWPAKRDMDPDSFMPATVAEENIPWIPMREAWEYNEIVENKDDIDGITKVTRDHWVYSHIPLLRNYMTEAMMHHLTQGGLLPGVTIVRSPIVIPEMYQGTDLMGVQTFFYGAYIFLNNGTYKDEAHGSKVKNPMECTAVHETGHVFLLKHQDTGTRGEDGSSPLHHAYVNGNKGTICAMSYHAHADGDFCGRCVLSLRGWNVFGMPNA